MFLMLISSACYRESWALNGLTPLGVYRRARTQDLSSGCEVPTACAGSQWQLSYPRWTQGRFWTWCDWSSQWLTPWLLLEEVRAEEDQCRLEQFI